MPQGQTLAQMVRTKYPGAYDDLSDQQLEQQVRAKFPGVYDDLPLSTEKKSVGDQVWEGVKTLASGLNPITQAQSIYQTVTHPAQAIGGQMQANQQLYNDALTAYHAGDYVTAGSKALNYLLNGIPGLPIGSAVNQAQEQLGRGDVGPGVANSALLGLGVSAPFMRPAQVPALTRNPNPVVAEAVEFGQARGVPIDAATATGSRAVSAVQHMADRSLGGYLAGSESAAQGQASALARVGGDLAAQAHPMPVVPAQAGESVIASIQGTIRTLHQAATDAYDTIRAAEEKSPIMVNRAAEQDALRPIYQSLRRQLPIAQQQASPGLKAIENVINGPDTVPLSTAEADLGAIKSFVRGAEMPELRGISQGLAAKAAGQMDAAIVKAARAAGPDVLDALQTGRKATAQKYQAAEVLGSLSSEPVRVFNQATYANDAGIEQLRSIAKLAPQDMTKIGRAWLDDAISKATAEGGFDKAGTLQASWQKLGPQTKALLFKDPAYIKDLDNFFLLAKRISANPNPSGTASAALAGAQALYSLGNPSVGVPVLATQYGLTKLLHSPLGVRLLTKGLSVPANSAVAGTILGDLQRAIAAPEGSFLTPVPSHAQKEGGE